MRNIIGAAFTYTQNGWLTFRVGGFQMQASFDSADLQADTLIDQGFDVAVSQGLLDQATADALQPVLGPSMAPLIDEVLVMQNERVRYGEFAIRAEKGNWFAMTEWTTFRTNTYVFSDLESWYVTAGVRQGASMFHLTYARYDQHLDERAREDYSASLPNPATTNDIIDYFARQIRATPAIAFASQWNTVTLGVCIDTSPDTALKFETLYFDQDATTATETAGIGHNMLFRTALNVTF